MTVSARQLATLARKTERKAVLQPRDFARAGLHPEQVRRLVQSGLLERAGRGRYLLPGTDVPEDIGLALVATAAPAAVVCLLTALRVQGIGTQAPREIWIAVDRRAAKPRIDYPPVRVVRFSGRALTFGIETREIGGISVRIYSAAKTVADCFKYRNKIGLDVALEALKDGLRLKRLSRDDLWKAAGVCRVSRVLRPYLEAI
jgi:predicted transcriptional regulator of viral defense system